MTIIDCLVNEDWWKRTTMKSYRHLNDHDHPERGVGFPFLWWWWICSISFISIIFMIIMIIWSWKSWWLWLWWWCLQVSRAGRRGEAAIPASDGKKNHLACPICRWVFAQYAGGLVIIMMITIMMIIICILLNSTFCSGSRATLKEWLRTSKHMCCNIEPANPFTLTLKILNSKKYLIDTLSLQYPFS